MSDERIERLKQALFNEGYVAISDFLGYNFDPNESKDVTDGRMNEVCAQMPSWGLDAFFAKYLGDEAVPYRGKRLEPSDAQAAMEVATICVKPSCFAPEFKMAIRIPEDRDAEEYIDELLDSILNEDLRYNVEWDFAE